MNPEALPGPNATSALYAVLGHPIAHSLSPALHNAAFRAERRDAVYIACDVPAAHAAAALEGLAALGAVGANLTSPLKGIAYAFAGETTPEAHAAGAVNTLRFAKGGAVGHNTDGAGFVRFLARAQVALAGARIAILGGGGAAAGLAPALVAGGATAVTCVTREPGAAAAYAGLGPGSGVLLVARGGDGAEAAVRAATIVIQSTPLGTGPGEPLPCPEAWVDAQAAAVDLRYHPARTPWLDALSARGVRAANGLGLLIEQALLAQAFWHGEEPPRNALEEAVGWTGPFLPPPAARRA